MDVLAFPEVRDGIVGYEQLTHEIERNRVVLLRGAKNSVIAGYSLLLKVNTSVGVTSPSRYSEESDKIRRLSAVAYKPDTIMDLSIVRSTRPLYAEAIDEFGGPVGTLPHYLCFDHSNGIDARLLLDEIAGQAEAGVGFMTFHLTPSRALYEKAMKSRKIATTSRGGAIVAKDLYLNSRHTNVFVDHLKEILSILRQHNVVMSLGTSFRPASVWEALDEVQMEELDAQADYIQIAREAGVAVMMEGLGHASLTHISSYATIVTQRHAVPMMPLGPIPLDSAAGEDHIASAIGAALMGYLNGAHIINSVTREEHTGGVPSLDSVLEGLRAAQVAAHAVNLARFPDKMIKELVPYNSRSSSSSCVVEAGLFASLSNEEARTECNRCDDLCPLRINRSLSASLGSLPL